MPPRPYQIIDEASDLDPSQVERLLRRVSEMHTRETEYLAYRFLRDHPELTVDQCEIVTQTTGTGYRTFVRKRQNQAILYGKEQNT